jgi:hypothetical protein
MLYSENILALLAYVLLSLESNQGIVPIIFVDNRDAYAYMIHRYI